MMAMMMTGRVLLLVCALCVLWCGAGWVYAREFENNAVGGCMASGVLGENGFHMPSGCAKTVLALPLRSTLPVTAAGVPTSEEESEKNFSNPNLKPLSPPVSGGSQGVSGGSGGAGQSGGADNNAVVGGVAGASGSSSGGVVNSSLSDSSSAATPSPSNPVGADDLQGSKGTTSTVSMDAPETGVKSQSARPSAPSQTNLDRQDVSITNAETQSSIKPHAAGNQIVNGDETGRENERKAAVTGGPPSNQQPTPLQPVEQEQPTTDSHTRQKEERDSEEAPSPPPAPSPTNSTEGIPATRELQISTEKKKQTSPSETQKELVGKEKPSKGDAAEHNTKGTATSDSVKDAVASGSEETTASPISTSGGADAQNEVIKDGDNAQRTNHKETHKHPEPDNTNPAPTANNTQPQTALTLSTVQTNDTATPGDSDGSTAVSHTTSPLLLLLVVACAAAAAVVAA
ncbi:Mucin-associated surface protein (MASP) subgroup S091 [Trypanosoma cruzi]|uniref:Mucin-associated surface protein (MASP) subgroup S091 n=1 Tax=Trypanosoma cruzi TaxID=5693 RepID=A0A7J6Y0V5_TRYCR|nr:Mucin-associated surface protein (MASP) subgroup S091 [Trypanosoma cruzi]